MAGAGCRAQLWSILGAIALLWTCGGIFYTMAGARSVVSNDATVQINATLTAQGMKVDNNSSKAAQGLVAMGALSVGIPFFLCSGLPFVLIFGLLANANRRAIREERRHQQQLAVMQQSAQAQVAQAQMQYMNMQQQAKPQQGLPAPTPPTASGSSVMSPNYMTLEVRQQFERAKELIQAKDYKAATKLLKSINHPKAAEWLAKLPQ